MNIKNLHLKIFLNLPVIDTLFLSPLAFPENPYHKLIKDYKLLKASKNNPVSDAKLAQSIFEDQKEAFSVLNEKAPDLILFFAFAFALESRLLRGELDHSEIIYTSTGITDYDNGFCNGNNNNACFENNSHNGNNGHDSHYCHNGSYNKSHNKSRSFPTEDCFKRKLLIQILLETLCLVFCPPAAGNPYVFRFLPSTAMRGWDN